MIVELTNTISFPEIDIYNFHVPKDTFSSARCETKKKKLVSVEPQKLGLTDVSHGPIEVNPGLRTFSILKTCCPE
jgi:hypothetical protein